MDLKVLHKFFSHLVALYRMTHYNHPRTFCCLLPATHHSCLAMELSNDLNEGQAHGCDVTKLMKSEVPWKRREENGAGKW